MPRRAGTRGVSKLLELAMDKRCSTCGAEYPATVDFFVRGKSCRGGIAGTCKRCANAYQNSWKARNRDRYLARRRILHAERHRESERSKLRRRLTTDHLYHRARILAAGVRCRSRELGLPVTPGLVSTAALMEWLSRQKDCECCGRAFITAPAFKGRAQDLSPSLDRIVPALGYVAGNVALICWRCNNLKRDATAKELFRVAKWLSTLTQSEVACA
jgi:hypothetical protein